MLSDAARPDQVRVLRYTDEEFRPYALALGQFNLAWNALYEALGHLYYIVMGGKAANQHEAVWNVIDSDRVKRKILRSATVNSVMGAMPVELQGDVNWLCGRADALEDFRNDAIHSPLIGIVYEGGNFTVLPDVRSGHLRARKLSKDRLLDDLRWGHDRAMDLLLFAQAMASAMYPLVGLGDGALLPWPDKPSWLGQPGQNKPQKPVSQQAGPHPRKSSPR